VSPKRGDRAAPPPGSGDWDVRFANNDAAKGWDELCRQAPANTLDAWTTMRTDPAPRVERPRHHALKGTLSRTTVGGRSLPVWQIEVTGAGRIWYALDVHRRTAWVVLAGTGHPKATD
jgi:hypothetical protein